ncbi:VOC family protein, partial [Bacillus sp. SIMBA_031]|uniref:VOC family protein n=1 Tax=Bacillus sp. SIMBA_031 TaxID=3085774 RepID=UPI00397AA808
MFQPSDRPLKNDAGSSQDSLKIARLSDACNVPSGHATASARSLFTKLLDALLVFCKCGCVQYRTNQTETTMTAMFVNLPVTDLERAKSFYTAIGFSINPMFTDHN